MVGVDMLSYDLLSRHHVNMTNASTTSFICSAMLQTCACDVFTCLLMCRSYAAAERLLHRLQALSDAWPLV